jgi:hypothetical protein
MFSPRFGLDVPAQRTMPFARRSVISAGTKPAPARAASVCAPSVAGISPALLGVRLKRGAGVRTQRTFGRSAGRVDTENVCAHVGKQHGGEWHRANAAELNDAYSVECAHLRESGFRFCRGEKLLRS